MSITDYKITDAALNTKGVIAEPDTLTGRAEENKAVFDRLSREVVAPSLNGVIDTLAGTDGAANVGAAVDGVAGDNVQAVLDGMLPAVRSAAAAAAASADEAAAYARQAAAHTDLPMARGISGTDSLVIGDIVNNTASATRAIAEGTYTTAGGPYSHASGLGSTASGNCASADGFYTKAAGENSHAEGSFSEATGKSAHAENGGASSLTKNVASGDYSHAQGSATTASGVCAHAAGKGTIAEGDYSNAAGFGSHASGLMSHAEGQNCMATHRAQYAFGEWNKADESAAEPTERGDYVEIVGNGTSNNARSNARTLDWDGNEWLAGGLTLGGKLNAASNENLFDNAYFIGGGTAGAFPVNQRGNTTGTISTEGFIDRWILAGSYNLYANSLWLGQGSFFSQKIDPALGAFLNGKMVTVSLLHADGTLDTGSAVYVASPSENVYFFRGHKCYACLIDGVPNQLYFVQDVDNVGAVAAKLELGDRQTLARNIGTDANPQWVLNDPPPDYRQELAKCQRYLQVFEGDAYAFLGTTFAVSSTSIEPILPLLVPMSKKTGSILASTTAYLQTNGAWNQQVTIPAGSNNVRISSNTAAFTISLTDGVLGTFPSMGAIASDGNTKIIISAE